MYEYLLFGFAENMPPFFCKMYSCTNTVVHTPQCKLVALKCGMSPAVWFPQAANVCYTGAGVIMMCTG